MGKVVMKQGIAGCKVADLVVGQRCDLRGDPFADAEYYAACEAGDPAPVGEHPEFEFETVAELDPETDDCIGVTFESGCICGFPPDHDRRSGV